MIRKADWFVLSTIVLTGFLLAACNSTSQPVDREPYIETAPQQQEVEEGTPAENLEVPQGDVAPTPVPTESSPTDAIPTARLELSATDPSTVILALGKPVLLEFFAFW
jgi:hypothetical protein